MGKFETVLKKAIAVLKYCSSSFISSSETDYCEPVQRITLVCEENFGFYLSALELPIKEEK